MPEWQTGYRLRTLSLFFNFWHTFSEITGPLWSEMSGPLWSEIFSYYKGNKKIDGMGIGLFLAKKLCSLLGYTIECKASDKKELYHLPAKYYYTKQNQEFENNKSLTSEVFQFLQKDISSANKELIVNLNINDWEITDFDLKELIIQPTYQNIFQITIPIKTNPINDNLKIKKIWE